MPSTSSDANASDSAWPQSMPPSSSAVAPALELARELRVDGEALGDAQQLLGQPPQPLLRDTRVSTTVGAPSRGTGSSCDFGGIALPNDARSRSCASRSRAVDRLVTSSLGLVLASARRSSTSCAP